LKQAGAIVVESVEEMADTLLASQDLRRLKGDRAAIITGIWGGGGGISVTATDACISQGLRVPLFTEETLSQLKNLLSPIGTILHNPLDITGTDNADDLACILRTVTADPDIDFIIAEISVTILSNALSQDGVESVYNTLIDFSNNQTKPLIVVSSPGITEPQRLALLEILSEAHIPVYPSFERAAKAIANVIRYHRLKDEIEGP
jgi:acyl-CoA synthetase (NDP forming)